MHDELAGRVTDAIRGAWKADDPNVRPVARRRADGKLDVTVISSLFESRDSEERERMLWSVLRAFPLSDTVQMTYSLLLTPSEAADFEADLADTTDSGPPDARKDPH